MSISWYEPRATFVPQLRADLARMGLPRWDWWLRPTLIAGVVACVFIHMIHRTAPGVPLPTGLLRSVIMVLLYAPGMTLMLLLLFYTLPPFIIVDRSGVAIVRGGGPMPIPWERIASATIEHDALIPVLTITFIDRRGDEYVRMIGISRRHDPDKLARFVEACRLEASRQPAEPAARAADTPRAAMPVEAHPSSQP